MAHRWRLPYRRRTVALLLFGAAYLSYGVGLFVDPHGLPGSPWVGGALFLSGAAATGGALLHRTIRAEWLAFTWLYTVAALFSLGHVAGAVFGSVHTHPVGDGLTWAVVAALVALIGGWPEPPPPHVDAVLLAYTNGGGGEDG